jgi:hypothetical protein
VFSSIFTRIQENEDLYLIGDSCSMVIAFASKKYNIFGIKGLMAKKGWNLNALQKPAA